MILVAGGIVVALDAQMRDVDGSVGALSDKRWSGKDCDY